MPRSETYRAVIGERTFEIAFNDKGQLTLDGRAVDTTFDPVSDYAFLLRLDGRSVPVVLEEAGERRLRVTIAGRQTEVRVKDEHDLLLERFGLDEARAAADREVRAPMPGLVLSVAAQPGQAVEADAGLLVLEAMKMENEIKAPAAGTVETVHVEAGAAVGKNDVLVTFAA